MKYLFLPGMLTDSTIWDGFITNANINKEKIIHPNVYDFDSFDDIIENIIKTYPSDKFLCIGMSMGGYICLEMLNKYPDKVMGSVIMNSGARKSTKENIIKRQRLISLVESTEKFIGINDILIDDMLGDEKRSDEKVRSQLKIMTKRLGKQIFINQQKAIIKRNNAIENLKNSNKPMLLLSGGQDNITPSFLLKELSEVVNNAIYKCYEDCGHVIPLENPQKLCVDFENFVELNGLTN